MSTYLFWVDVEASGLDVTQDEILEIAVILTDTDLVEISRYHALVRATAAGMLRAVSNPAVFQMHIASGLATALAQAQAAGELKTITEVEADLNALMPTADDIVHIAGSGVAAFDFPLLKNRMPTLSQRFNYAPIDVGSARRLWQWTTDTDLTSDEAVKAHRALADVEGHLNEARAVRAKFLLAKESEDSQAQAAA